ncbi:MAG: HAD family phosphatase [Calditrichaeota bacterium]|nr:MAG: HAD family phosphatase [Calditrichota bacterium]MBL1204581.1 HAD family phosphatase [Calditrichota bacterium]NOG44410.1 HAD family phosphatase [Calditrichota bacterium]
MKIEAIIFDLGRVLVDVDFSGLFNKYTNPGNNPDFSFTLEQVMTEEWFIEHSSGKCNDEQFFQKVRENYNIDVSLDEFKREWASIFKPMPEMETFLKQTAKKYPVGLLSDTDAIHWNFLLKEYPFLKMFTNPILSFEIGAMKPAEICYLKAADSVNTVIENCLFIDDRQVNVDGAVKAGMQAVQFESNEKLKDFFKMNNL